MGNAFGAAIGMLILGLVVAIPISMIMRAWLVDGTLEAHFAVGAIGLVLSMVGVTWAAQGTGWMLLCVALLAVGCIAMPLVGARLNTNSLRRLKNDDLAKYRNAIAIDANNASAHAFLADALMESKQYGEAIAEYETAIALNPRAEAWQRKLQRAVQEQAGQKVQTRLLVCPRCGAESATSAKSCARCGEALQMGFARWLTQPGVGKDVARAAVPSVCIALGLLAVFSALPLEWKACVLCACTIVGAYYALRSS